MRKRLVGLLASAVIVFAACRDAATRRRAASAAASTPARLGTGIGAGERRARRRRRPHEHDVQARGRARTAARSSSATGRKPTSSTRSTSSQVTEANVASARLVDARRLHQRLQVRAGPRAEHPDARQRRRQGPRRRRRRDDRHVDPPRRPQVVGRPAAHLRRLQVRARSGSSTRTTSASSRCRLQRTSATFECTSDTEMVLHFKNIYEGYITLMTRPAAAPLPREDPDQGPGQRRRLPGRTRSPNMPVSGAFKFESVTPQQELRLAKNPNYTSFSTGKPAHLDTLIWKWYGDADLMIAGFKAGEVDFATDLQDSDIPKVQDLGDQVSAIPALLYEFLRPNWSEGPFDATTKIGGCSRNPAVQDRGTGCPMADPAMREAVALRDRQERDQHPAPGRHRPGRQHEHLPRRLVLRGPDPGDVRPREGQVDPRRGRLEGSGGDGIREKDGLKAKIELCTTTRQVRDRHPRPDRRLAEGRRHRGGLEPGRLDEHLRRLQRGDRGHPVRASRRSNFDLAEHAFSSLDRPARQLLQLPLEPVRAGGRERRPGEGHRHRRGP